jgi:Zn-dependent peptidase ImmA (M78 family)
MSNTRKTSIKTPKNAHKTLEAKLGAFTYKIHFSRQSDENHGLTDTSTKEIWINSRFDIQVQKETLLHELLHVALEDFPLFENPIAKADEQEEYTVRYISPRLHQFLADNEELNAFIFWEDGYE